MTNRERRPQLKLLSNIKTNDLKKTNTIKT